MKNEAEVINRLKSYEPLWDDWVYNGKLYGSGGSGCVLGLSKGEERSVVKVIYIEDNQLKYNAVKDEIETMATLRSEYLVECLDYRIEKVNNQKGEKIGKSVIERNRVLFGLLTDLGVDKKIAVADASRMEHGISEESLNALTELRRFLRSNRKASSSEE